MSLNRSTGAEISNKISKRKKTKKREHNLIEIIIETEREREMRFHNKCANMRQRERGTLIRARSIDDETHRESM